jgi:kinase suppressor of Ras 2
MKPPKLAIVMSLCRGVTLHKYLYMDTYTNKPNSDEIILICIQIAQGMGYLHAKNLLHKDLRSKNIFIEGNRVIISDFGLYSLNRLCNRMK